MKEGEDVWVVELDPVWWTGFWELDKDGCVDPVSEGYCELFWMGKGFLVLVVSLLVFGVFLGAGCSLHPLFFAV